MTQKKRIYLPTLMAFTILLLAILFCGHTYGAEMSVQKITISEGGIYTFEGTMEECQIYVAAGDDETVTLHLSGVTLTNSSEPAIYVANAGHTEILLEDGTENLIQSGLETDLHAEAEEESQEDGETVPTAKAAIYARDDLSITGSGSLTVLGYINNGIQTTNHLTIDSGTIQIEASNTGIKGKDSVTITGGSFTITSGGDGIKSNDTAEEYTGAISILGGDFTIVSQGDGIQAETALNIAGGTFHITSGDGSEQKQTDTPEMPAMKNGRPDTDGPQADSPMDERPEFPGHGGSPDGNNLPGDFGRDDAPGENEMPEDFGQGDAPSGNEIREDFGRGSVPDENEMPEDFGRGGSPGRNKMPGDFSRDGFEPELSDTVQDDTPSAKGIKSGTELSITGGQFVINSEDDGIHCNGTISLSGGDFTIKSGDDGIHGDASLSITGGAILIEECYEGLEANQISIADGTVEITSSDDGVNANGSFRQTQADELPELRISGGSVHIHTGGDGLDSNGSIDISGGLIIVDGPSDGGNGAIDYGSENGGRCTISGGTILALGSSGMAETFDAESEQCSFLYNLDTSYEAGNAITILDGDGTVLFTYSAMKSGNSIVFSSPALSLGETCTIDVNGETLHITLDTVSASVSGYRKRL